MTTDEFTKQYAIRQPDGKLWGPVKTDLFGQIVEPTEPAVFTQREAADSALAQLKASAAQMGVEWLGVVETRLCTPFSVTDPSEQMIAELEAWRREQ